jgi:hypothetical protein
MNAILYYIIEVVALLENAKAELHAKTLHTTLHRFDTFLSPGNGA